MLKTAEFMPYVVFIAAPEFDTLKAMHKAVVDAGLTTKQLTVSLVQLSQGWCPENMTYPHYINIVLSLLVSPALENMLRMMVAHPASISCLVDVLPTSAFMPVVVHLTNFFCLCNILPCCSFVYDSFNCWYVILSTGHVF